MVFSNILFIYIFLPLCLLLFFSFKSQKLQNAVLILFSLTFYAWGEPVWMLLLVLTALIDYLNGRFIGYCKERNKKTAVLGLIFSLVFNLGVLSTFKYSGFIVSNINSLFGISLPVPSFIMPIGVSFYTFQTLTYVIDVYKGNVKPQKSFFKYLLFISLFFQLVAGPIVRYETIAKEIDNHKTNVTELSMGMTRFIYGLAKKVIIANTLGGLATDILAFSDKPDSVFSAWFGVIMFSLQIYYDFSGYSDMAIGLGWMCGFHFLENFDYPYISGSATEFWRSWHMSLGTFFREYVYIPLGGNRKHQIFNLAVVWLLTGLWHGASWNFIIWGCYFGFLIILEKAFLGKFLEKLPKFISHIYLIFIVILGWTVFYFTDLNRLAVCLKAMFGGMNIPLIDDVSKSDFMSNIFVIIIALVLSMPIYKYISIKAEGFIKKSTAAFISVKTLQLIGSLTLLFISTILLVGQTYNPFLYYRF